MAEPNVLDVLAESLLAQLRTQPGQSATVVALQASTGMDGSQVSPVVDILRSWGYEIRQEADCLTLVKAPDILTATEVLNGLATNTLGRTVHAYGSVGSTNDIAVRLTEEGAAEGSIVIADEQTRGRGRLGRSWVSRAGCGIYFSVLLRPDFPPDRAPGVSVMSALALADTIEKYVPGRVRIKWPNDVLIDGRKTAGILTELSAERGRISSLVVGVGINVNHSATDFPDELTNTATSISIATGHTIRRVELLQTFLRLFEIEYGEYCQDQLAQSIDRLRSYSSLIGKEVELVSGENRIVGTAVDINADGSLALECKGKRLQITSGEVTVARY